MSGQRREVIELPKSIPAVVLAAGKGTRLNASQAKAAVQVAGKPMVARVVDALRGGGASRIIVVVGHRASDVRSALGEDLEYVVQGEQLGTGHAARQATGLLAGFSGPLIIAYADIPLLRDHDITRLLQHHIQAGAAATLLTAVFDTPGALGRIVRDADGRVLRIVEARDASPQEIKLKEINVGVYCFTAPLLFDVLDQIKRNNAQHQYYLTDAIGLLVSKGERVEAVPLELAQAGLGVDTKEDLTQAERLWMGYEAGS